MPHVVNRHHYRSQRRPELPPLPAPWLYVGRGTPLGNPNSIAAVPDVAENLRLYRRHLWTQIEARDPEVIACLNSITMDTALVCSCAPRPCHAQIIVAAWEWWCERMEAVTQRRENQ